MTRIGSTAMPAMERAVRTTGLTIVFEPDIEAPLFDIVFIHGFNGHPKRTWTHKRGGPESHSRSDNYHLPEAEDNQSSERSSKFRKLNPFGKDQEKRSSVYKGTFWPRDLLPQTTDEKARIMTFGYDTNVHHRFGPSRTQNTVYDFASEFLKSLGDARLSKSAERRPLLFIAHSLGGIITKEALRQANLKGSHDMDAHLQNVFLSTVGIAFFGTPHRGADPRGFLQRVAEKVVRAAGLTVNQKVFELLLPDSERLKQLLEEFPRLARQMQWKIVSFQETVGMAALSGNMVVDKISSCLGDSSLESVRDIESDHRDMCRFSGLLDPRYEKVAAPLQRIVQSLRVPSAFGEDTPRAMFEPKTRRKPRAPTPATEIDGETLSESQYQGLMDGLRFKQMDARLLTLKTAQAKTCRWLLKNQLYRDWTDNDKLQEHHGFFWIKGKPGTGKSITMKFLFSEAKKSMKHSIVLSFFFNARGGDLEKSTLGLYRSLLLQLLEKAPEARSTLDYYGISGFDSIAESGWQISTLQESFLRAVEKLGSKKLVCYIDALDECPEDDIRDMISFFEQLGELEMAAEFRVCFSSRHYPEISIRTGLQLVLESEPDHTNDITLYIDSQLKVGSTSQAEDIKVEILQKSSNIFLWVALVIPILNKEYDRGRIKALKRRLREIPAGLHDLFLDIITRDHRNLQQFLVCIQCILFAARPFSPKELRIAVETGSEREIAEEPFDPAPMNPDNLRKFLLDSSKGLAEMTKSKEPTVQFIHESVRDFLLREEGMQKMLPDAENFEGQGHDTMKRICQIQLRSAISDHFRLYCQPIDWKLKYPLLEYATQYVFFHADSAQKWGMHQGCFLKIFNLKGWITANNLLQGKEKSATNRTTTLLYFLGELGCSNLINIHPDKSRHFDIKGGQYLCPLLAAMYSGHSDSARALVDLPPLKGEADAENTQYRFALKKSAFRRGREVLTYLCEFGDTDILRSVLASRRYNFQFTRPHILFSKTDMECILYASSEAIVDIIVGYRFSECSTVPLPCDSLTDSEPESTLPHIKAMLQGPNFHEVETLYDSVGRGEKFFSYAARKGFANIFNLCLIHTDVEDSQKRDALRAAFISSDNQKGRKSIIESLIGSGQNLSDLSPWIGEAMCKPFNEDVVDFVVSSASVDVDTILYFERSTALIFAIKEERKSYVKMLLSAGANPNVKGIGDWTTALIMAVKLSDLGSFRQILKHSRCEVDARDNNGRTALSWCATVADDTAIAMVSELREASHLDLNSRDHSGQTVLARAVRSGNAKLVEALCTRDTRSLTDLSLHLEWIDPNLALPDGTTPLMLAIKLSRAYNNYEVFWNISRLLLKHPSFDLATLPAAIRVAKRRGLTQLVTLMETFRHFCDIGNLSGFFGLKWNDETGYRADVHFISRHWTST